MPRILVVDDDRDLCLLLHRFLTKKGFEVTEAFSAKKALEILDSVKPDLVLSDFRLEDTDGLSLLNSIKEKYPAMPVIIITGYSDIKTAVEIIKMGAYDYVTKPLFPEEILVTIKNALEHGNHPVQVAQHVSQPQLQPARQPSLQQPVTLPEYTSNGEYVFGDSPSFHQILKQVSLVAPTNYSIIIYGESGSGKEVIAQHIHSLSSRKDQPFIAIDCGALSKELAGSELFGHEKGSFTGALSQKTGSFELANGGTIFLDEIANLSYDVQVSLLRVVQERKMRRIGGNKDIDLDVRIIVASNEKLLDAARKGKFREDLYHRFNEFGIEIPPLRERKEDIMFFARHFLSQTNRELGKKVVGFTEEVEKIFREYVWYGNLRELKNVIKRATLLQDGDLIEAKSLPFEISNFSKLQFDDAPATQQPAYKPAAAYQSLPIEEIDLKHASLDAEYEMIMQALKKSNFNKSKAAQLLNIDRKTLYNKMKQYKELNNL
ncbi:sigma-54-dependent transcriptional regulator [Deminuibacter soli]|uniref:Sigma-54-dependent Fis family transcriptional regulator n=1 Tax=Deminuibacter soli TaxID=2291815 RepID=A0A3E1NL19_9BACT|nr:sigma-54 dependent transcriptional regulator [Deminuibacter soli]RFM28623.1 sigma-54-dependent Fis family transcriptional regulator [Deminuibacter soli]